MSTQDAQKINAFTHYLNSNQEFCLIFFVVAFDKNDFQMSRVLSRFSERGVGTASKWHEAGDPRAPALAPRHHPPLRASCASGGTFSLHRAKRIEKPHVREKRQQVFPNLSNWPKGHSRYRPRPQRRAPALRCRRAGSRAGPGLRPEVCSLKAQPGLLPEALVSACSRSGMTGAGASGTQRLQRSRVSAGASHVNDRRKHREGRKHVNLST